MQDIFIGVDGGGTKSKVRVEDDSGKLIGQALGGPANIRLSVPQSWEAILTALKEALQKPGINLTDNHIRFHIGLGLAGCEVQEAMDEFLAVSHGFASIHLTSDAHVACIGAHQGNDGAIIIVGTGVVGYQVQQGDGVKVGGWGFPHDDEGGGAWLGLEAVRLTFQWLDQRIEQSPLVEEIFAYFDNDLSAFASWANRANSSEFAKLAPIVTTLAQKQEFRAVRLMKKAAEAVERVGIALAKCRSTSQDLPICLFGGIAPFVEPLLTPSFRASLAPRRADANAGAIWMIKNIVEQTNRGHHEVANGARS